MILSNEDLISLAFCDVICRNSHGAAVATLSPREVVVLARKNWVEGVAREKEKNFSGRRNLELRHVNLLVDVKKALSVLNRKSAKQVKAKLAKAQGSITWQQVGASSYWPHFRRCAAFEGNALRIGVTQA